jgi:hypothetical protein
MTEMIRVRPAADRRREFAIWAVAQSPKLRTVGPEAFAVPADLLASVPEELLIGATLGGQPYVPVPVGPPEDAVELTGVDTPPVLDEQEATVGEPLPPLPESAYPADAVPLPEPEPRPEPRPEPVPVPADTDELRCPHCPRTFTSRRGLNAHARQAHTDPEG